MNRGKKQFGATWWGEAWIAALEALGGAWPNRLGRGRTYARRGNVVDLFVMPGEVYAMVRGSRPKAYVVRIRVPAISDAAWDRVVAELSSRASFGARLLAGEMPPDIEDAFEEAGVTLFPRTARELRTRCDCPDSANPCKHVAAVHYVLADALDADPWLLFEIRGRKREQVLDALRRARGRRRARGTEAAPAAERFVRQAADTGGPAQAGPPPHDPADFRSAPVPLPDLRFSIKTPAVRRALLRSLGEPAAWSIEQTPDDLLGPALQAAADYARELAHADPSSSPGASDDAGAE